MIGTRKSKPKRKKKEAANMNVFSAETTKDQYAKFTDDLSDLAPEPAPTVGSKKPEVVSKKTQKHKDKVDTGKKVSKAIASEEQKASSEDTTETPKVARKRRKRRGSTEVQNKVAAIPENVSTVKRERNSRKKRTAEDQALDFLSAKDRAAREKEEQEKNAFNFDLNDDSDEQLIRKVTADEYAAERELMDIFGVDDDGSTVIAEPEDNTNIFDFESKQDNSTNVFEDSEKEENQNVVEEMPKVDYTKNVTLALKNAVDTVDNFQAKGGVDDFTIQIKYLSKEIPSVLNLNNALQIANYRVYVNGRLCEWDELYEIKFRKGSKIELETGVSFRIPEGYCLEFSISEENQNKFSVNMQPTRLSAKEARQQVILWLNALEGAYLSKIGRVIECRVVKE